MSEPYLGQIQMFAGNFAPRGWALCNGQLLSIGQNSALFAILGFTYGGDGQTLFALPNLQGRFPTHFGQGPGLTSRTLGEVSGAESVTLTQSQMPTHSHPLRASSSDATASTPADGFNAVTVDPNTLNPLNSYGTTANATLNATAAGIAGGSQPHENMPPYLCLTFIIALEGIFPSRN